MPIKPAKLIAVLLLTSAVGAPALGIEANRAAGASLRRLIADHEGLAIAGIGASPLPGHVVLHGVKARSGATLISIGALHLPAPGFGMIAAAAASPLDAAGAPSSDPSAPPPAPGAMGSVSADNVVITSGTTTFRIKRIEMTGTNLSNADLAALIDAKTPESLEVRFKKLSAAAVVIPEIVANDTTPGSERHATMKQILLANVKAGKVALGSASETSFALRDGDDAVNGATGAVETADLDLAQIAHVFGTKRSDDGEPVLPLYDSLVMNTVKLTNVTRNSTLSLASIKETGVKGRALRTDLMAAGAAATQAGSSGPSDAKSTALFDDMAHSFVIGSLEMTDVASRNEASEGVTTFGVKSVALQNFADRKIGGLSLHDFRLAGPDATFGIGTLDVGPFTIPPSKDSVAAGVSPKTMTPPAKVEIGQIDVDVVSPDKNKPGTSNAIKFKVDHVGFASDGRADEIPPKASLVIDKLAFDVTPNAGTIEPLYAMGYRHVNVSGALATTYDAGARDLTVDALSVKEPDMGSIGLKMHLINVGKGLLSSNPGVAEVSALAVLAKAVDLKVKNAGLFQKALELKAKKDGMSVAEERDFGIDFFANKLPASMNDNVGIKTIGAAIAKFIADPKSLHITIESKAGIGIAALGLLSDPDLVLDSLEIHATADE